MQITILAGGLGTQSSEETVNIVKPTVRIGQSPVNFYLMKYYASFEHTDFIIALGYQGNVLKEYFSKFDLRQSSIDVNLSKQTITLK